VQLQPEAIYPDQIDPEWQQLVDLQEEVYEDLFGEPFDPQFSQFFLYDQVQDVGVYDGFDDGLGIPFTFTVVEIFEIDFNDPHIEADPDDIAYLQSIEMDHHWCIALMESNDVIVPVIAGVYSHLAEAPNRTNEVIIFGRLSDSVISSLSRLALGGGGNDPDQNPCEQCLTNCLNTFEQDMAMCSGFAEACLVTIIGCAVGIAVCAATCLLSIAACTVCLRWVGGACVALIIACATAAAACALGAHNKYAVCRAQCLASPACENYAER
jgi:hypothetical protein